MGKDIDAVQRVKDEFQHLYKKARGDDSAIETLKDCAVASGAFWMCQNALQVVAGFVGIHSGRTLPVLCSLGLLSTIASSSVSMMAIDWRHKLSSNTKNRPYFPFTMPTLPSPFHDTSDHSKLQVTRVLLGVGIFCLLELQGFKTALPSSIITTGIFARNRGSIAATSEVATAVQRVRIQQLGWRYGCHHCGSRQVLSLDKTFIADHMPPTKFMKEMNAKWWRRMLGLKVSQRLYPQCLSCFSMQGSAVKNFQHIPKYHYAFRLPHLAPALAILLSRGRATNPISQLIENF